MESIYTSSFLFEQLSKVHVCTCISIKNSTHAFTRVTAQHLNRLLSFLNVWADLSCNFWRQRPMLVIIFLFQSTIYLIYFIQINVYDFETIGKFLFSVDSIWKTANQLILWKKTHSILNFETIPIHYNKGFIVVLYLYVEELFKYFYLIIFSKSFQIKPSWFGVIPNMQWSQPGETKIKTKALNCTLNDSNPISLCTSNINSKLQY